MRSEPAAIIGAITASASAILVLLRSFGVPLTEEQQQAINGFVAVLAPIIAAFVIRSFVFAPDTVAQREKMAAQSPPMTPDPNIPGVQPTPPIK